MNWFLFFGNTQVSSGFSFLFDFLDYSLMSLRVFYYLITDRCKLKI